MCKKVFYLKWCWREWKFSKWCKSASDIIYCLSYLVILWFDWLVSKDIYVLWKVNIRLSNMLLQHDTQVSSLKRLIVKHLDCNWFDFQHCHYNMYWGTFSSLLRNKKTVLYDLMFYKVIWVVYVVEMYW
jgi:hypothetical protein